MENTVVENKHFHGFGALCLAAGHCGPDHLRNGCFRSRR